jgi:hypothetical protein
MLFFGNATLNVEMRGDGRPNKGKPSDRSRENRGPRESAHGRDARATRFVREDQKLGNVKPKGPMQELKVEDTESRIKEQRRNIQLRRSSEVQLSIGETDAMAKVGEAWVGAKVIPAAVGAEEDKGAGALLE